MQQITKSEVVMAARKSKPPAYRRLKVYITAAVAGAIAAGAALLLFALMIFFLKLPVSHSRFFSLLSFGTGCLVAGFFAGRTKRRGGIGSGIKAALLFTLPVVLLGFTLGDFSASPPIGAEETASAASVGTGAGLAALNKLIIAVLCGAAGGVAGVNKDGGF